MEKEILIKVSRYITLSKKFQKSEADIFDKKENNNQGAYIQTFNGTFTLNSGSSIKCDLEYPIAINGRRIKIDQDGTLRAEDKQPITRAEKLLAQAKLDAIIADEYDEYIKLQSDLTDYFKSLENLTK